MSKDIITKIILVTIGVQNNNILMPFVETKKGNHLSSEHYIDTIG